MKLEFTKMHGIGNDYIYIDCFKQKIENIEELAIKLSDRHFGIGGDGIILICPSNIADAKMRMFNLDGSEGKMCGNGIRCVAKFVYDNNICKKERLTIETLSGVKTLDLTIENEKVSMVKVDMGAPILEAKLIPTIFDGENVIDKTIKIDGNEYNITCVSMGNPHCVIFCDDIDNLDLVKIGTKFEKSEYFPESVNTEFIEVLGRNKLKMRVWERGSGETLACGTGACGSAVAAVLMNYCDKNTDIDMKLVGGNLIINYTDETVFMTGSATKVFEGTVEI